MKKRTFSLTLMLVLTLLAGIAIAHPRGGNMMNSFSADEGYGFCNRYMDIDREEVTAITDKYADQFDALREKMFAKRSEMRKARRNDATTMGQMNKLREEMLEIRTAYRDLASKVDVELSEKFGEQTGGRYVGMMDGQSRPGMMGGGMMGRHEGYGGCR